MAKAAACDYLRPYVTRGDNPEWWFDGGGGSYSDAAAVTVGSSGWRHGRKPKYGTYSVVVTQVWGEDCCYCFDGRALWAELAGTAPAQLSLLKALDKRSFCW